MSEPSPNERPRQVTLAGSLAMVGSVLVVLLVFDRVSGLHTIETRESVEGFLSEPPGSDLGIGVDGVLSLMRTLALVAGGIATATAILGFYVLRRHRTARLVLTLLAVPLFATGLVTGGFVSSLVAASVLMLWLKPSRDWFDGITPRRADVAATPVAPAAVPRTATTSGPLPAATGPAPGAQPAQPTGDVPARPSAVIWACVLTWIASAFTVIGTVASGVLLAMQPDTLLDEVRRQNPDLDAQGVTDDMLVGVTFAMIVGIVLWCVAAAVLALLVLRRVDWARITLVVSAATTAVIFLVATVVGAFLLALLLAASVATIALLLRPDVRAWFARPAQ